MSHRAFPGPTRRPLPDRRRPAVARAPRRGALITSVVRRGLVGVLTVGTLPALAVGAAIQPVAASAPPTTTPGASTPAQAPTTTAAGEAGGVPTASLPAGYVQLVDDTGVIAVVVPEAWTDIDTAPDANDDGTPRPYIAASTDIESFTETFVDPGVIYAAFPFEADPQVLVDEFGLTGGCETLESQPYQDAVFTGVVQVGTNCGQGAATWNMVAASPADQSLTAVVQVHTASPADQEAFDTVLASFNVVPPGAGAPTTPTGPVASTVPTASTVPVASTPGATTSTPGTTTSAVSTVPAVTTPGTTAAAVPTVPVATTPGSTVPGAATTGPGVATTVVGGPTTTATSPSVPAGSVRLVDDTQFIGVIVPEAWTDVLTAPLVGDDGTALPQIQAAPDITQFLDTFDVPGVTLLAAPYLSDQQTLIDSGGLTGGCESIEVQPYEVPVLSGLVQVGTNCGAGGGTWNMIVASPADQSITIVLQLQSSSPADQAAFDLVLQSFTYAGAPDAPPGVLTGTAPTVGAGASATGPTTVAGPTTTLAG